ncbi:hypothetical protein PR003_g4376 [Phytophthora rubi]|uniref:Uncharacterized protein n=1 Tax=Phytophthora rubi TaxID=129364 RepID=A0A6A3NBM6_9STRA|nr:hypothetical protein PR002_g4293 [Phytophthora rubi]KAE9352463.1 hypothetical protein PR003_g4376 [Phytophthora rubi]
MARGGQSGKPPTARSAKQRRGDTNRWTLGTVLHSKLRGLPTMCTESADGSEGTRALVMMEQQLMCGSSRQRWATNERRPP